MSLLQSAKHFNLSELTFSFLCARFMPCLKYIMQNAVNTELKLLRGKTIECISLIGLAVGKDKVPKTMLGVEISSVIREPSNNLLVDYNLREQPV